MFILQNLHAGGHACTWLLSCPGENESSNNAQKNPLCEDNVCFSKENKKNGTENQQLL